MWPSLLWGHCFFPLVAIHLRPCVHPLRVEFLFSSVSWNSCNQIPPVFKATFSGASLAHLPVARPPSWGAWCGAQNFTPVGELWYNCFPFQFVGRPPGVYGIWFYHDCAPPPVFLWLICLWTQGIFLAGCGFFVQGYPAVSCDLGFWKKRWAHVLLLCHLKTQSFRILLKLVCRHQTSFPEPEMFML